MRFLFLVFSLLACFLCRGQKPVAYRSLDPSQPVLFTGTQVIFSGDTINLGPKSFFIDGALPDSVVSSYPYVFNSVNKAAAHLTNGTEAEPMVLYLAPWVYWIDDPDDPAVRVPKPGSSTPYGLEIACEWLRFQGLSRNPENVVLAAARGQTIGARGNFTMFRFSGEGTRAENLSFGNYCNVDLVFPLKPSLGRPRKASAIVQAQLIHCNGDKIVARNTRFISRLNLCPFVGGKRVLFDRCHFESTDDALCGTGVYLNSTLDFYASKPFYNTVGTGAVFLHCAIRSFAGGQQFFTKAGGQVALIDSRLTATNPTYWGWQDALPPETRNYQANVTLNGQPLLIGKNNPASTVNLKGKPLLNAYRFAYKGVVVYNTYGLLRGTDDWDPMGIKSVVQAAGAESGQDFTHFPVQLRLSPDNTLTVETKKDTVELTAQLLRFGNVAARPEKLCWQVAPAEKDLVRLLVSEDGLRCRVIPTNEQDRAKKVVVTATAASGLQGACVLNVLPPVLEPPAFRSRPLVQSRGNGNYSVNYRLAPAYKDESDIRWYRCTDARGSNAIEVAVSRLAEPLRTYRLSAGDVGYHLAVSVAPKHLRSRLGEAVWAVRPKPITAGEVKENSMVLATDFRNLSTKNQPRVIPGFWTLDYPEDKGLDPKSAAGRSGDAWYYGEGADGAAGQRGLLQGRTARLLYTPAGKRSGDMTLTLTVLPFKTAGQGFSVAHLYMDVLLAFDTKTMSGYALRLIRTTKHGDAVDCLLMKYTSGEAEPLSEPVTTTAFRSPCTIAVTAGGGRLSARVTTGANAVPERPGIFPEASLEADMVPTGFGGFGIEYNGGSPTMIREMQVEWK